MADELKESDKQNTGPEKGAPSKKKEKPVSEQASANAKTTSSSPATSRSGEPGGAKSAPGDGAAGKATGPATAGDVLAHGGPGEAEGRAAPAKRVKGKSVQHVPSGIAHINATFNNTHVTITDRKGGVIAWSSSGRLGFAGAKKSSAYAATLVAQDAARQASACRLQEVEVRVQGPGSGRESAIRALQSAGLTVNAIQDVTPIPHNGCRPRKRRRV